MDTATYGGAVAGVRVSLRSGFASGGAGFDRLLGIERVVGSRFGDRLKGDGAANLLRGGTGDDLLVGGGGDDWLIGKAGSDVLRGDGGDDILKGGNGADTATFVGASRRVVVGLASGTARSGDFTDRLFGIEHLVGSSHNDLLDGNRLANIINGRKGDDVIRGAGGDDLLVGQAGNDRAFGNRGRDICRAEYEATSCEH